MGWYSWSLSRWLLVGIAGHDQVDVAGHCHVGIAGHCDVGFGLVWLVTVRLAIGWYSWSLSGWLSVGIAGHCQVGYRLV